METYEINYSSNNEQIVPQINIESPRDGPKTHPLSEVHLNPGFVSDSALTAINLNDDNRESISADILNDNNNNNDINYDFHSNYVLNSIIKSGQREEVAVKVRNVTFGYNKKNTILNNVSITVAKGKIYALLGSSGCGKTTLLRTILGRLTPKKGSIKVFGVKPGSRTSSIPGRGVGYMPQELALFKEFTIEETLKYFGKLYNMDSEEINRRTEFLTQLLNLPHKNVRISTLSGGQQRRTSLATTLFHSPPLLILDEPTVGVDPLLRCRIWEYLENICNNDNMTVIVTTHYIEEARSAATVGFMRFGRLLTQSEPQQLLLKYKLPTLEEVFLRLCEKDCGVIKRQLSTLSSTSNSNDNGFNDAIGIKDDSKSNKSCFRAPQTLINCQRLSALFMKNYLRLKRNPLLFFFFLILPVVQITLFCASFGKLPHNLPLAIYSPENPANLSAAYLERLNSKMIRQVSYDTLESAIDAVKDGKAWFAISMSPNYTEAFDLRAVDPSDLTDQELEDSKIKLYADMSDSIIGNYLYRSLLESYNQYLEHFISKLGYNPSTVTLPIQIEKPVYGVNEQSLDEFLAPGAMVAIIYSTPLIIASFLLVLERNDGLLERSFVAGARPFEVFFAQFVTMILALICQVSLLMLVSFVIFMVPLRGSVIEVFALIFLNGLQGITVGLLLSAISPNESVAIISSFGLIFPMWMITGVFWPLESVPTILRSVFYCAPLSLPIQSLRFVVSRGWSLLNPQVLNGYLISALYNTVLFTSTAIVFQRNSS